MDAPELIQDGLPYFIVAAGVYLLSDPVNKSLPALGLADLKYRNRLLRFLTSLDYDEGARDTPRWLARFFLLLLLLLLLLHLWLCF